MALNLPTIKYRRHRGDMIELFKGVYDHACIPHFDFVELSKDLINLCVPVATNTSRRYLRSATHGDLQVPRRRTVTYGP